MAFDWMGKVARVLELVLPSLLIAGAIAFASYPPAWYAVQEQLNSEPTTCVWLCWFWPS
jgi:hypothetical protein